MIVRNISRSKICCGGIVVVYGAGFSYQTKAWFDAGLAVIIDYSYDEIKLAAPSDSGTYTLYLGTSFANRLPVGQVLVVNDPKMMPINLPDEHSVCSIRDAILGLMPRGFAWYKGSDGIFSRLMLGIAKTVSTLYSLTVSYRKNASPSHTDSLNQWEYELQLPESGTDISGTAQEIETKRRAEIFRKSCKKGGNTVPFFEGISKLFGRDVSIYEYFKNPEKFAGVDFGDDDPNFYWMIEQTASDDEWHLLDCNGTCNDYLAWWWNPVLESFYETIKPAHTKIIYTYKLPEVVYIMSEEGDYLMSEDGDYIVSENGNA